jgi:hypothetical protein
VLHNPSSLLSPWGPLVTACQVGLWALSLLCKLLEGQLLWPRALSPGCWVQSSTLVTWVPQIFRVDCWKDSGISKCIKNFRSCRESRNIKNWWLVLLTRILFSCCLLQLEAHVRCQVMSEGAQESWGCWRGGSLVMQPSSTACGLVQKGPWDVSVQWPKTQPHKVDFESRKKT